MREREDGEGGGAGNIPRVSDKQVLVQVVAAQRASADGLWALLATGTHRIVSYRRSAVGCGDVLFGIHGREGRAR